MDTRHAKFRKKIGAGRDDHLMEDQSVGAVARSSRRNSLGRSVFGEWCRLQDSTHDPLITNPNERKSAEVGQHRDRIVDDCFDSR